MERLIKINEILFLRKTLGIPGFFSPDLEEGEHAIHDYFGTEIYIVTMFNWYQNTAVLIELTFHRPANQIADHLIDIRPLLVKTEKGLFLFFPLRKRINAEAFAPGRGDEKTIVIVAQKDIAKAGGNIYPSLSVQTVFRPTSETVDMKRCIALPRSRQFTSPTS